MHLTKIEQFKKLHDWHYLNCDEYRNLSRNIFKTGDMDVLEKLPYVPVELFKLLDLKSVPAAEVSKVMHSSGTTGQQRSKINLTTENSSLQKKVLVKIVSDVLGSARVPILILDIEGQIKNPNLFTARSAGILGFLIFGTKRFFALTDDYKVDLDAIEKFVGAHTDKPQKLVYGFTSIIWEEILEKLSFGDCIFGNQHCILIHGGGWKKLESRNISSADFKNTVHSKLGPNVKVVEYYGMVEQTGSIYMGCEHGYLHTNEYNDIIVRNPQTLQPNKFGEIGVIQTLSTIAWSYPGYSILTEDIGVIHGVNDCKCGQSGTYFEVKGRLPKAELRGCSNTYAR